MTTVQEDVGTLAGRLATFERPHHLAKRRASAAKKKAPPAVTWPHEKPTPEEVRFTSLFELWKEDLADSKSAACARRLLLQTLNL